MRDKQARLRASASGSADAPGTSAADDSAESTAQHAEDTQGAAAEVADAVLRRPSGIPLLPAQRRPVEAGPAHDAAEAPPRQIARFSRLPAPAGPAQPLQRQQEARGASAATGGEAAPAPSRLGRPRRALPIQATCGGSGANLQSRAETGDRRESPDMMQFGSPLDDYVRKQSAGGQMRASAQLVTPRLSMSPERSNPLSQLLAETQAGNADGSPKEGDSELSFAQRLSPASLVGSAMSAAPRHEERQPSAKQASQSPDAALQAQQESDFHFPIPPDNTATLFGSQSLMPGMDCSRAAPGPSTDPPCAEPLAVQHSAPRVSPAPASAAPNLFAGSSSHGSSRTPGHRTQAGTAFGGSVTPEQLPSQGSQLGPRVQRPVASAGLLDALSGVTLDSPDSVFEGCDRLFRESATPTSAAPCASADHGAAAPTSSEATAPRPAANIVVPVPIVSPRGVHEQRTPTANAAPQLPQASSLHSDAAADALQRRPSGAAAGEEEQIRSPPRGRCIPRTPFAQAAEPEASRSAPSDCDNASQPTASPEARPMQPAAAPPVLSAPAAVPPQASPPGLHALSPPLQTVSPPLRAAQRPPLSVSSNPFSRMNNPFAPSLRIRRSDNGAPQPDSAVEQPADGPSLLDTNVVEAAPMVDQQHGPSAPTSQPRSPPLWMPMSAAAPNLAGLAVPEQSAQLASQPAATIGSAATALGSSAPAAPSPHPQPAFVSPALPAINTQLLTLAATSPAAAPRPSTPVGSGAATALAPDRAPRPQTPVAVSPAAPYAISVRHSPCSPAWRVACFPQRTASLQASPSSPMVRLHAVSPMASPRVLTHASMPAPQAICELDGAPIEQQGARSGAERKDTRSTLLPLADYPLEMDAPPSFGSQRGASSSAERVNICTLSHTSGRLSCRQPGHG